MEAGVMKNNAV